MMSSVQFMGSREPGSWKWPEDSIEILSASILDVQAFKNRMVEESAAQKTINRRISSLSSFYKFLAGAAARVASYCVKPVFLSSAFNRASPRKNAKFGDMRKSRPIRAGPIGTIRSSNSNVWS